MLKKVFLNCVGFASVLFLLLLCESCKDEFIYKPIPKPAKPAPWYIKYAGKYTGTYSVRLDTFPYTKTTNTTTFITVDSIKPLDSVYLVFKAQGLPMDFETKSSGRFWAWPRVSSFNFGKDSTLTVTLCQTPMNWAWYWWDLKMVR